MAATTQLASARKTPSPMTIRRTALGARADGVHDPELPGPVEDVCAHRRGQPDAADHGHGDGDRHQDHEDGTKMSLRRRVALTDRRRGPHLDPRAAELRRDRAGHRTARLLVLAGGGDP
jgi:hypothetical protein